MLERHLEQANEHVTAGERDIARQKRIIAELERDGHDAARAHQILGTFETLQKMHIEDRDRVQRELAGAARQVRRPDGQS